MYNIPGHSAIPLLPCCYFGPVSFFARLTCCGNAILEQHDSYRKQSYRNRCIILAANGPLSLSLPVVHMPGSKPKTRDVRIDYSTNWQKQHERSLVSAYRSSPFFDYYEDLILPIFKRKHEFLVDLNLDTTRTVSDALGINLSVTLSTKFVPMTGEEDARYLIDPKTDTGKDRHFDAKAYIQVFSDRFGFVPNLSILDLLFNCGPEAKEILSASYPVNSRQD